MIYSANGATLLCGDCLDVLDTLADNSIDAFVSDPPYHLTSVVKRFGGANAAPAKPGTDGLYARQSRGFMNCVWDGGDIAFRPELWAKVLRVLKPGGYIVAFSGSRTYHRMACAIEDAGFEIRDQIMWIYGTGWPKSLDISKAIDKEAGHWRGRCGAVTIEEPSSKGLEYERTDKGEPITAAAAAWDGFGTALKPSHEPICLARKPIEGTNVENVLKWGTGALNIDGCRIESEKPTGWGGKAAGGGTWNDETCGLSKDGEARPVSGRWPANTVTDGSDEVLAAFPSTGGSAQRTGKRTGKRTGILGEFAGQDNAVMGHDDPGGSAAQFFYSAKASKSDRAGIQASNN